MLGVCVVASVEIHRGRWGFHMGFFVFEGFGTVKVKRMKTSGHTRRRLFLTACDVAFGSLTEVDPPRR